MDSKYQQIKKFIEKTKQKYVIFYRNDGYTPISKNFNTVFPDKAVAFEMVGTPAPYYQEMASATVNQKKLDKTLPDKDITFYIQTVTDREFVDFVTNPQTHQNCTNGPRFYDIVIGENENLISLFNTYLQNETLPKNKKNLIYKWNPYNGAYYLNRQKTYDKSIDDLIGLKDYYNTIIGDINNSLKYKDKLIRLGESNGSNYMLYGPPGTGKSSFVRALACELNVPIYIANIGNATSEGQITAMLCPDNNGRDDDYYDDVPTVESNIKIVLIEDFDRYIESAESRETMSAVLNALDGIYPAFGVFRFFSANNPQVINKNKAMSTRMNNTFFFARPNVEQITAQVKNVFSDKVLEDELVTKFVSKVATKKFGMREITHYLCRFIQFDNPMKEVLNGVTKWFDQLKQFDEFKDDSKKDDSKKNDSNKVINEIDYDGLDDMISSFVPSNDIYKAPKNLTLQRRPTRQTAKWIPKR